MKVSEFPLEVGGGATSCTVPPNFRFAGMQWDENTGLYHTWFREYDTTQGRWTGVDPLAGSPDDPQSFNRYVYARNDPVNLADSLGLQSCRPGCICGLSPPKCGPDDDCPPQDKLPQEWQLCSSPYDASGSGRWECTFGGTVVPTEFCRVAPLMDGANPQPADVTIGPPREDQRCVQPNFMQRIVIRGLEYWAKRTGMTLGIGLGASGGIGNVMGVAGNISRQLVVSPNGRAAFLDVTGTNAVPMGPTGGVGGLGGIQVSASNATSPLQLAGYSVNGGVGGGHGAAVGTDVSVSDRTVQVNVTLGFGGGGYGQALTHQVSGVMPLCPDR